MMGKYKFSSFFRKFRYFHVFYLVIRCRHLQRGVPVVVLLVHLDSSPPLPTTLVAAQHLLNRLTIAALASPEQLVGPRRGRHFVSDVQFECTSEFKVPFATAHYK